MRLAAALGTWSGNGRLPTALVPEVVIPEIPQVPLATAAEFRAKSAGKIITADKAFDAAAPVNLGAALAGNITLNFSAFLNAYGTLTANITLANVSNLKQGQSGTITLIQSGGPWTLSVASAYFETPEGKAITLGTGRNKLAYEVQENGKVFLALAGKALA